VLRDDIGDTVIRTGNSLFRVFHISYFALDNEAFSPDDLRVFFSKP
jgi:hypothetical protein